MSGQTAKLVVELVFTAFILVSLQGLPFTLLYFIYIDLHRLLFIHTYMVSFADYRLLLLLLMLHLNMELNLFQKPIVNILHVPDETHKVGTLRTVVRFNLQVSMFTFLWLQI